MVLLATDDSLRSQRRDNTIITLARPDIPKPSRRDLMRKAAVNLNRQNQILNLDQKKIELLQKGKKLLHKRSTYSADLNDFDKSLLDPLFKAYAAELVELIQTYKSQYPSKPVIQNDPKTSQAAQHKCIIFSCPAKDAGYKQTEYQNKIIYQLDELNANNEPIFNATVFLQANGDLYEILLQTKDHEYYLAAESTQN